MSLLQCDESYQADLAEYMKNVFARFSVFSPTGERETLFLADEGNTVALKLYADMVFNKKILRKNPYAEAFSLYLKASDLHFDENGSPVCGGKAYPLSFWQVGYCLVTYHRSSYLRDCETIPAIEALTLPARLSAALILAVSCIEYTGSAEGVNLAGRVLSEIACDEALFTELAPAVRQTAAERTFPSVGLETGKCENASDCAFMAETFFRKAAEDGYIYACNSLAAREAERIIRLSEEDGDTGAVEEHVRSYVHYLTLAADRYEPYAANRLGLFYQNGEIKSPSGSVFRKDLRDRAKAKEYFYKATVYPDANTAWALLNLQKYYPTDYISDIGLLNDQLDWMKELNPAVYDIAMDL